MPWNGHTRRMSNIFQNFFPLCLHLSCGLAIYKQTRNTCRHISLSLCVPGLPVPPAPTFLRWGLLMSSPATNRQKDTNSWLRLNENCGIVVGRSLAAISFPPLHRVRECVYILYVCTEIKFEQGYYSINISLMSSFTSKKCSQNMAPGNKC